MGKAYGLNTHVLLANLQNFCCNNIIILNYYYFIRGLFPSNSWWAESCSVRLSRGMVCSRQPRSFQGVDPDGQRTDDGTVDGTHGFRGGFISHPNVLYYIGYQKHTSWIFIVRKLDTQGPLLGPVPHRNRDYPIGSDFWKFYLNRTCFTLGDPVSLVKVFRLVRLEWIVLVFRVWTQ